jgi:site-specific recombinase XerC
VWSSHDSERQFQNAREAASLPDDLVLYCARHGFGTEMYRATKNLFAVMKVMGHAAVTTTMKNQHQEIDEIVQVASQRARNSGQIRWEAGLIKAPK